MLGIEWLHNPGSISPPVLSNVSLPSPDAARFCLHYVSTICVRLILGASGALP